GARLARPRRQPETRHRALEGDAMIYELRDHPDDLPIPCETLEEVRHRARRRAERFGIAVLIYEMDPFTGERLLEEIG
ncbi:hypothetical protein, partial [uncultured Paracoccus sp.]|uniref:hypothetical protein n=1 Tax=uncultured Paracoccus sp. TaxID=189685 RepID=UPI0032B19071